MSRLRFGVALAVIVALALTLRLIDLDVKPLHQDEGANGTITLRLLRQGVYEYDPSEYHGPLLFYASAAALKLLGTAESALRAPAVLAGVLVSLLCLPLRPLLGSVGLLVVALLVGVAPGMVYFSRTAIHEIQLVAGSVVWAAGLLRFVGSRASVGRPWQRLVLGSASSARRRRCSLRPASLPGWGWRGWRDAGRRATSSAVAAARRRCVSGVSRLRSPGAWAR